MSTQVAEIVTVARVDLSEFNRKIGEHDKRIEQSAKKARGGPFFGGFLGGLIGGTVGGIIGGAESALGGLLEAVTAAILVALLPAITDLLIPALEALTSFLASPAFAAIVDGLSKGAKWIAEGLNLLTGGSADGSGPRRPGDLESNDLLKIAGATALVGAGIGSVVPGVGTLAGAGLGFAAGYVGSASAVLIDRWFGDGGPEVYASPDGIIRGWGGQPMGGGNAQTGFGG